MPITFAYLVISIVVIAIIAWLINIQWPLPAPSKGILNVMLGLIVIGILLWLINNYVPMAQSIKDLLNVVVFIASLVWVLQAFGLWTPVVAFWNRLTTRRTPPVEQNYEEPRHSETVPRP